MMIPKLAQIHKSINAQNVLCCIYDVPRFRTHFVTTGHTLWREAAR